MRASARAAVLAAACAVAVGACTDDPPRPAPSASVTAAAACGPVEHPEEQSGGHLVGDAEPPVPYSSTPGTSGWHAGGAPRTGLVTEPLSEPELVLALEVGQVVAAYDSRRLDEVAVDRLRDLAGGRYEGQLTVTPFDGEMGAPLTLNAWATRQACEQLDVDVLARFVAEHAGKGPGEG